MLLICRRHRHCCCCCYTTTATPTFAVEIMNHFGSELHYTCVQHTCQYLRVGVLIFVRAAECVFVCLRAAFARWIEIQTNVQTDNKDTHNKQTPLPYYYLCLSGAARRCDWQSDASSSSSASSSSITLCVCVKQPQNPLPLEVGQQVPPVVRASLPDSSRPEKVSSELRARYRHLPGHQQIADPQH